MLFQNLDDRAVFVKRGLSAENAPLIPGSGVDDDKFKPVATNSNLGKKQSSAGDWLCQSPVARQRHPRTC